MPLADVPLCLPLELERYELDRRESRLSPEFTRVTTTVVLRGRGETGRGEDVTYAAEDHDGFPAGLPLAGSWTVAELSAELERYDLFAREPHDEAFRNYRRWAFESAALDLALRQVGRSLGSVLGRAYGPVRFVASTRGDALGWLAAMPALELKLDPAPAWTRELMERLAASGRVRVLDLKGYYRGTVVDNPFDPELYRDVAEIFPDAVIEDAWLADGGREALAGAEERLSFDAPVHSLADLDALPLAPRWLNVKPSRFGTLARLFECVEACEERGIRMYGGGQSELGVGRRHIQVLASLFYPGTPNDTAPSVYNEGGPRAGLPESPLPPPEAIGF